MVAVYFLIFFLYFLFSASASCPRIITRKEWNARCPETIDYVASFPLDMVVIDHTATRTCKMEPACAKVVQNIQEYHLDVANLGDIGYNFLIGGDGNVYEGRGWHKHGAHKYGSNGQSVGIAFIGDFRDDLPSDDALQAAKNLMECGVEMEELTRDFKLHGAKQLRATLSPGAMLYNRIMNWPHWSKVE